MGKALSRAATRPCAGRQGVSDLTDPENNGHTNEYKNHNAIFRSSIEPHFYLEGAFNVFDNQAGAGDDRWCCDLNGWVEPDFGARR